MSGRQQTVTDTGDLSQKTLKEVRVLSFVLAIWPFFFNLRSVANPATVANIFNPSTHQAERGRQIFVSSKLILALQ